MKRVSSMHCIGTRHTFAHHTNYSHMIQKQSLTKPVKMKMKKKKRKRIKEGNLKTKRKTIRKEKRVLCIQRVNLNVTKLNFLFKLDRIKLLNVYCLWYAGIADNNT